MTMGFWIRFVFALGSAVCVGLAISADEQEQVRFVIPAVTWGLVSLFPNDRAAR